MQLLNVPIPGVIELQAKAYMHALVSMQAHDILAFSCMLASVRAHVQSAYKCIE